MIAAVPDEGLRHDFKVITFQNSVTEQFPVFVPNASFLVETPQLQKDRPANKRVSVTQIVAQSAWGCGVAEKQKSEVGNLVLRRGLRAREEIKETTKDVRAGSLRDFHERGKFVWFGTIVIVHEQQV